MKTAAFFALARVATACVEHPAVSGHGSVPRQIGSSIDQYLPYNVYPNEQKGNSTKYLAEARKVAGDDLYAHFSHDCVFKQAYSQLDGVTASNAFVPSAEVFRDFYYLGQAAWNCWAYDTGDGLILYDTMLNSAEIERIVLPGLAQFGFKGEDIKYAVVSHEHLDHYGGAKYLQDNFNTAIVASEKAWVAMEGLKGSDPEPPVRNDRSVVVRDGDGLALGRVTTTFYETPGHTNGTISWMFPVTDLQTGEDLMAGYFGGSGAANNPRGMVIQINSHHRFGEIAKEKGVSVLIGNHYLRDRSLYHLDVLAHRVCDQTTKECNMANPFVVGVDGYYRWQQLEALCIRTLAARQGFMLSE